MSGCTVARAAFQGSRLRLLLSCLLVLLALADVHAGPAQEAYQISIDQVIVSEDDEGLTAFVSVLDPAGQPVPGLTDFQTSVDGTPVPLESVEAVVNDAAGISVLLLIDVSGSMAGEPLAEARAAATSLVEGLLDQDVVALVPFAGGTPDGIRFETDRGRLLAEIAALARGEEFGTALYDAVVESLANAAQAPTVRRAVVLLTDGKDSEGVSERTRAEALFAAAEAGLPIYAIGLGEGADIAFLRTLAQSAGGGFYEAPNPSELSRIFDDISLTLRSQYALTLPLPPAARAQRELLVSLGIGGTTLTAQAAFEAPVLAADAASESDGLPSGPLLISVVLALALVAAGAAILIRRRLRRQRAPAGGPGHDALVSLRVREPAETGPTPSGRLSVVAGPNAGVSVPLGSGPVDIGTGRSCGLRLDAADNSVGATHARAWLQSNRLMLHHLARRRETLVGEKAIEWATLEPNDSLRIGPHVIAFTLDG